jgi:PKD repeat protein
MKKNLLTALTALILTSGSAQSFFTKTCYRGAFAPAPAAMWTDSWTEWDPVNKVYPAPTMTITGNITSSTTWATGSTVLLSAQCFVTGNSVLTIQPGVVVMGDKAVTGAGLFITTGSQLIANGTPNQPIVFTSNQPAGGGANGRARGDWGGVILMGLATNNCPAGTGTLTNPSGTNYIEGLPVSALTQYGGNNDNDNSGSLQYVRIEFAGYAYQPSKEINGLTFGSIGKGTTIDHVQVSFSNDDAFEWFGGTVNCKHLVAYRCLDDDFDTDFGFRGNIQFGLSVRDPQISDDPTISTSEGFESDNDPGGTTSTPKTAAIFSNMTMIGPLRGNLATTFPSNTGFQRGARIRRNSELKIYNSIFTDHRTRGVYIDGTACETNAAAGTLRFMNNIVGGYGVRATEIGGTSTFTVNQWIVNNANDTLGKNVNASSFLTQPYNFTTPDYRPIAGSLATSGASFVDAAIAAVTGTTASNVMATTPTSICIGSNTTATVPATFVATTTLSADYCSLSWSVTPGVSISSSTAINPSFTISTLGTFTVTLMVTDANGLQTSMSSITTNTCLDVAVGELKNLIGAVSLYPNPASESAMLKISSSSTGLLNVNVYDLTGKLVLNPVQNHSLASGDNQFVISTTSLYNGIYFVTLSTANGKETVKLVVNK